MNIRNKKASGTIFPCIMILVLCMIISVLTYFVCTVSSIRVTKENSRTVFESYITEHSIEIYDSIKQGNDYIEFINNTEYVMELCRYCTFEKIGEKLYSYDDEGNARFYMTEPTITFVRDNSLKIRVSYTIYYPIVFNGNQVSTAVVPVEIKSSFMERY